MNLILIGSKPVLETESHRTPFKDYEALITHINRFNLVDKVQGLGVLPIFWYKRLNHPENKAKFLELVGDVPDTDTLKEVKQRIASRPVLHEAHVAQLLTLS